MSNRTVFLLHGAGRKPSRAALEGFWREALGAGLGRDRPDLLDAWAGVDVQFVYYGDWSSSLHPSPYDEALDLADRRRSLDQLKVLDKAKRFRRMHYERLPGKSSLREFLADIGLPLASQLGIGKRVLARLAPELDRYWAGDEMLQRGIDERFEAPLAAALEQNRDVMIVAHCVGSVVAFDTLWRQSRAHADRKIRGLITLGTPLADETVKKMLAGADERDAARYPANIITWHNLAAEDDYMCHDGTVGNDYAAMLKHRLISVIEDQPIYNLAVRFNRSNPHSAAGYLIHPRMSRLLADWLDG